MLELKRALAAAAARCGSRTPQAAACTAGLLAGRATRQVHGSATAGWATLNDALSSGKTATSVPPDVSNTGQNFGTRMARDFDKAADLYLGGLFEKINAVGQVGQLEVQMGHEGMKLRMPDGGKMAITKDPESQSLVVHSNLHDTYGSDGAADTEVPFQLTPDRCWEASGEELHSFIEDGLAKHLKVQVDLEPDAQTIYGPDPT